jgi:hypothetical protein
MDKVRHEPFYHFSVDDVFGALIEFTDSGEQLFENPFFASLKQLHDAYETNVDLYLFYRGNVGGKLRTLQEVSPREKETFEQNRWIRFGPHSLDYESPPYAQAPAAQREVFDRIYSEVHRFAGTGSTSSWVRLHYFSESYELASYFHERGVHALLATDKAAGSHRMPDDIRLGLLRSGLAEYQGMQFIRTYLRAENLANDHLSNERISDLVDSLLSSPGFVTLMSHEKEILRGDVRSVVTTVIRHLRGLNVESR